MIRFSSTAFVLLLLLIVLTSGIHGGAFQAAGSLLLILYLLLAALPAARLLFGESTDTLVFAFPIGYALHCVLLSMCALIFGVSKTVLILYLVLILPFFVLGIRCVSSFGEKREIRILFLWLLCGAALILWPLCHVGAQTAEGLAYRAYFNADFFKHMGITGALSHGQIPPANPYFSGRALNYYWLFYIIPAYWSTLFSTFRLDSLMVQFTMAGSLMFVACLFCTLRTLTTNRTAMLLLFPLFAFGGSYEGLYSLYVLHGRQQPFSGFTDMNIDAITRWLWKTPQIDTLYRAMLYAPQHLIALCMFLLFLQLRKKNFSTGACAVFYALIYASLGLGVLIGALLIAGVLLFLAIDFARRPAEKWKEVAVASVTGIAFLVLYFPALQMFRVSGGDLQFGLIPVVFNTLPRYLFLNWGAILILGIAGVLYHRSGFPLWPAIFFLTVSIVSMNLVKDRVGGSEVTLKLGYFATVCLLILAAGFLDKLLDAPHRLKWAVIAVSVLVAPGLVTWCMEWYNNQDITNARFTTVLTNDDNDVLIWARENLPADAILQNDTVEDPGLHVTVIASFAQRGVYLGDQFHAQAFQVSRDEYEARKKVVWSLFHAKDQGMTSAIAQKAGIQYIFVGSKDPVGPAYRDQFHEPYFSTLIRQNNALLVRVNPVFAAASGH